MRALHLFQYQIEYPDIGHAGHGASALLAQAAGFNIQDNSFVEPYGKLFNSHSLVTASNVGRLMRMARIVLSVERYSLVFSCGSFVVCRLWEG